MKVVVVSEFYPRQGDPVLGVWAHRQALAARDAGAEVRVIVLHRLVPRARRFRRTRWPGARSASAGRRAQAQVHDGLDVTYVRYASPPRSSSYPAWGAWAAPALGLALRRLRRSFAFELIHAHNAVPAGDAVRRTRLKVPLVVSVHGGDVLYTAPRSEAGSEAVRRGLEAATTVLANSRGIAELSRSYGAGDVRVVHLGADLPSPRPRGATVRRDPSPSLVTVGHLVARKRHADVMRALAVLAKRHPSLRYVIIGDGPERDRAGRACREAPGR